jgi:maleate isomerase
MLDHKFNSMSTQLNFKPDQGPGKFRIGLILLSNDYVTERDFINIRPNDEVAIFSSRVQNTRDCTLETLPKMAPHITKSAGLILPDGRLDVIVYSCTSGTIVMGYDKVCDYIHAARPGVSVVTPITASLAALGKYNANRISVLTPYIDNVNEKIATHLQDAGKYICAFTSFHIEDNELMATIPPDTIYEAALKADRPEAEALFISCTAIRAVDVVERIENKINKPVITANQAMAWQAFRWSGYSSKISGYGTLLSSF